MKENALITCKNRIGRRWLRGVPVDYENLKQNPVKLDKKLKNDKKKCNCDICKKERKKYEKITSQKIKG